MSDEVAVPKAEVEVEETETPAEDMTTLRKRLSGKDQALTRIQQERDRLAREAEELRQWKLSKEQADMTEYEKLQARLQAAEDRAAQAEQKAQRADMARRFPLALSTFSDDDPLPSEATLAALEKRIHADAADETEHESRVLADRPRREPPARPKPLTYDEVVARAKNGEYGQG